MAHLETTWTLIGRPLPAWIGFRTKITATTCPASRTAYG
jgi:hypothetical protein